MKLYSPYLPFIFSKLHYPISVVVVFCILLLGSCQAPITGSGALITKSVAVTNFSGVLTDLECTLSIEATDSSKAFCSIGAQQNISSHITTVIEKDELLISLANDAHIKSYEPIKIIVHTNKLQSTKLLGNGNVKITDKLTAPHNLMCSIMGSGNIEILEGNFNNLRLQNSGSGIIKVANAKAIYTDYALKGSGKIEAAKCPSKVGKSIVQGNGKISVHATDSLLAETDGNGEINYNGNVKYKKIKPGKLGVISPTP